jgi:hypothetical protein
MTAMTKVGLKVAFLAVAGFVGAVVSQFLPELPGLRGPITLAGTVAAIGGAAVGIPIRENKSITLYLIVAALSVAISIVGLVLYLAVAGMEPGTGAALSAYAATIVMFFPIGLIVEIAGLKLVE